MSREIYVTLAAPLHELQILLLPILDPEPLETFFQTNLAFLFRFF